MVEKISVLRFASSSSFRSFRLFQETPGQAVFTTSVCYARLFLFPRRFRSPTLVAPYEGQSPARLPFGGGNIAPSVPLPSNGPEILFLSTIQKWRFLFGGERCPSCVNVQVLPLPSLFFFGFPLRFFVRSPPLPEDFAIFAQLMGNYPGPCLPWSFPCS